MAIFISIENRQVYNRFKDNHIGPDKPYETNVQKEIGFLCATDGLLMEGTREHKEWLAKQKPVAPPEPKHKGRK